MSRVSCFFDSHCSVKAEGSIKDEAVRSFHDVGQDTNRSESCKPLPTRIT